MYNFPSHHLDHVWVSKMYHNIAYFKKSRQIGRWPNSHQTSDDSMWKCKNINYYLHCSRRDLTKIKCGEKWFVCFDYLVGSLKDNLLWIDNLFAYLLFLFTFCFMLLLLVAKVFISFGRCLCVSLFYFYP